MVGVGSRGGSAAARRGPVGFALACLACASTVMLEEGRWHHRGVGYSVEAAAPGWQPLPVDGADLAFRGPGGATQSVSSRCDTPLAEPRVLARHLVIGVPERTRLDARAVTLDGRPGWVQRYELGLEGANGRLTTVTSVMGKCVVDFVLLEPGGGPGAEAEFERWWGSFRWDADSGRAP